MVPRCGTALLAVVAVACAGRTTTHVLFDDGGASPPLVATLPLLIDGATVPREITVREGDDVDAVLRALQPPAVQEPLSEDNIAQVTAALSLRVAPPRRRERRKF